MHESVSTLSFIKIDSSNHTYKIKNHFPQQWNVNSTTFSHLRSILPLRYREAKALTTLLALPKHKPSQNIGSQNPFTIVMRMYL